MMKRYQLGSLILFLAACSSSTDDPDGLPQGGSSAGGSGNGTAGTGGLPSASGSGGQSSGGTTAVSGGGSGGGASGSGSGGTAGGTTGGGGQSTAGGGGTTSGGTAGAAGSGGAGGGSGREVKPSPGCAQQSAQVTIPNSRVGIPMGYTGKDPVPVVIAIHAAGNDNTSMENTFKNSDLAKKYLMVYPNSSSATSSRNGWNMQADKNRFLEIQAAVLNDACVDENRVYATGHSSGAQFIVALLCSGDAQFDAVAPVASSVACQKWKNGPVPALIIHGVQDEERTKYNLNDGDGKKDLQPYLASNECSMMSTPFDPALNNCSNTKGLNNQPFNDGCVEYSGCKAPTKWCNHNDPAYGTTNHGIPCFGVRAIYDFFESL